MCLVCAKRQITDQNQWGLLIPEDESPVMINVAFVCNIVMQIAALKRMCLGHPPLHGVSTHFLRVKCDADVPRPA